MRGLRDSILETAKPSLKKIEASGHAVWIPSPANAAEFCAAVPNIRSQPAEKQAVLVFMFAARDENGQRMFAPEDYDACAALPWPLVNKVCAEFWKANGYDSPNA